MMAAQAARRVTYSAVRYQEPDGRKTWAVREMVWDDPDYFRRQLVSFHSTQEDAESECFVAYRKAGIDV